MVETKLYLPRGHLAQASTVHGRGRRTQKAAFSHTDAFWDHLIQLGVNSNWTPRHLQKSGQAIARPSSSSKILHPKVPKNPSLKQSHNDPELPTASGQASRRSLCPGTNKVKGLEPPRGSSSAYLFGFLEPAAWPLEAQVHQCLG